MILSLDDIKQLAILGNSDGDPDRKLIELFRHRDYVNRQHGDTWRNMVGQLNNENLIAVYKALVILEREIGWVGGSVAGAIWVYQIISQRHLDNKYLLAEYGLQNCDNPWVPFGNAYYGRRTLTNYKAYVTEKANIRNLKAEQHKKLLNRENGRKEKRSSAIAELRKLTKEQRREIRAEMLDRYETSTILERLELMAAEDRYPPEYYPAEWIKLNPEEFRSIPISLVVRLYDKLSTKTKGEWRRFGKELLKLEREHELSIRFNNE